MEGRGLKMFNLGQLTNAIQAGINANNHLNVGPIDYFSSSYSARDSFNNTIQGDYARYSDNDFIWGHKWGNKNTRVTK
jgi:hypothetical protein